MSEEEITGMDECDTEGFGTLDSSEKTVVIKGDRWWPQAKREGDKLSKRSLCSIRKQRDERPNVG